MKGDNIFERLLHVAVETVKLVEALPTTVTAKHIGQQLVRSSTSAGANYQEARGGESRNDFAHKLGVALKEVCETHYWLRLVDGLKLTSTPRIRPRVQETLELSRILAASIRTSKANTNGSQPQDNRQQATGGR